MSEVLDRSKIMINQKGIDKVIDGALVNATSMQISLEKLCDAMNISGINASATITLGMIQLLFNTSQPGEAVNELETFKRLLTDILEVADRKFPEWDEHRIGVVASNHGGLDEFKKLLNKIVDGTRTNPTSPPIVDNFKKKRDGGDKLQ